MIAHRVVKGAAVAAGLIGLVACGGANGDDFPSTAILPSDPGGATWVGPAGASSCVPIAGDVEVASEDLNGYPPYAASGCTLIYVNRSGALLVRDLATGAEAVIAPPADEPRRPTIAGDVVAWEGMAEGRRVVRVLSNGETRTIGGAFVAAGEPRARGTSIVFTAFLGEASTDDTDVWLYDVKTREARMVLGGKGQQRFADVNDGFVVATDFSEDPDGRFDDDEKDLADIVTYDRATTTTARRRAPGKQAFPMLAGGAALAYLDWSQVTEPKLAGYDLKAGLIAAAPTADRVISRVEHRVSGFARPAAGDGTVEWVADANGIATFNRAPVDGSDVPSRVTGLDGLLLFAPAPAAASRSGGQRFTVVATARIGAPGPAARLRIVPR